MDSEKIIIFLEVVAGKCRQRTFTDTAVPGKKDILKFSPGGLVGVPDYLVNLFLPADKEFQGDGVSRGKWTVFFHINSLSFL
jgi:hypothetical protein